MENHPTGVIYKFFIIDASQSPLAVGSVAYADVQRLYVEHSPCRLNKLAAVKAIEFLCCCFSVSLSLFYLLC
jgi:hypothetical protein